MNGHALYNTWIIIFGIAGFCGICPYWMRVIYRLLAIGMSFLAIIMGF